jgi:hypothetical protein
MIEKRLVFIRLLIVFDLGYKNDEYVDAMQQMSTHSL